MYNRYKSRQQNDTYNNTYHTNYIYYSGEDTIIVMMTVITDNNAHAKQTEHRRIHNKHKHNPSQHTGIPLYLIDLASKKD